MMFYLAYTLAFASIAAASSLNRGPDSFVDICNEFASRINVNNATLGIVEYVPAGSNISLAYVPSVCSTQPQQVAVDLCRVNLNISTSHASGIRLEAWFPRNYTGRFLSTGNGGLGGCIAYTDLAFGTQFGFAAVGANNGHDGDTGKYFLNNPEVIEDFAYRSVHTGVVIGKELINQFYSQKISKAYYIGCSTGGRQGYKSAQDFPEDFDGILAGSPALNFVNLASWGAYASWLTGSQDSSTFLTAQQWEAVHQEVLRQCDSIDGAEDGIIEDPDLCSPIIETLVCNNTETASATCLTGAQAMTVNSVFSAFYGPEGLLYYPRLNPGAEADAAYIYYTGSTFTYSQDWYRYVVFNDSNWDPSTWTPKDAQVALNQNPFNIQTFNGDISAFRNRNGRLLSYHGTADPVISSDDTKLYYRRVSDTMELSPWDLDEFYRLFPISGMGHCGGGTGANFLGQSAAYYLAAEPSNNLLLKLVDWVEKGVAPDYIRGAAASEDGSTIQYTRKHCRYPRRNVFVGPGNYTDEDSWQCT